jgi:hypothetical protein
MNNPKVPILKEQFSVDSMASSVMNRHKGPGEIQCLKNVAAHHQTSLEDQATEIQCIEQNLKSFHELPNYNQLYEVFT